MPNKNYLKGVRKERKLVNDARQHGLIAARTAGSHSPIDVFMIDKAKKIIVFVQCKPDSMSVKKKSIIQNELSWLNDKFEVYFRVE